MVFSSPAAMRIETDSTLRPGFESRRENSPAGMLRIESSPFSAIVPRRTPSHKTSTPDWLRSRSTPPSCDVASSENARVKITRALARRNRVATLDRLPRPTLVIDTGSPNLLLLRFLVHSFFREALFSLFDLLDELLERL